MFSVPSKIGAPESSERMRLWDNVPNDGDEWQKAKKKNKLKSFFF